MRKLFSSETHISVPYYLLWIKLNKTYSIVNLEQIKQKYQEEIYILESLSKDIEIDFSKVSHEAIGKLLTCVDFLDANQTLSWRDIQSTDTIVIFLLSMNLLHINLSCFYPCQFHYLHYFKRMHSLSSNVTQYSPVYLDQENIYELDHEEEFVELGTDMIEEMGLEVFPIEEEEYETLSTLFDIPLNEIKKVAEETWGAIAETIDGISPSHKEKISKLLDCYPVQYSYQIDEESLYLYYGEEPLYGPYKFEMLLDLLETIFKQGETTHEDSSNI
ncbi:TPA: hypothetical protein ACOQ9V_005705 [Bacillus cereus]|uniref:hypothetical protein n=1 Tax=Bacillus cereus TaxID=1396 RepID=UPI0019268EB9|nr:hypothetical protein [Bacillus cereus]MBL3774539.1 hypothetical protein [Bacillus cereus]MBL3780420.1 hypothetical protein [Bacillus cereus]MBL3791586.1 hypothetical protein [Bacillus cereus]HDR8099834.1 hypothetical protein [Bacillus cereus]HEF5066076.1 hypothetical protein [Bacillus cereus]